MIEKTQASPSFFSTQGTPVLTTPAFAAQHRRVCATMTHVHAVSLCPEDAKLAKLQRAASHFGYSTSNKSGSWQAA